MTVLTQLCSLPDIITLGIAGFVFLFISLFFHFTIFNGTEVSLNNKEKSLCIFKPI